jgi:hypothetical protein
MAPPPIYRSPVVQPPAMRPPAVYDPIYNPTRTGIGAPGGLGSAVVLPPVLRPVHPIHPASPVIFVYAPHYSYLEPRYNFCWWTTCDVFWPWINAYTIVPSPAPVNYLTPAIQPPVYVYGGEREDFPQLLLKDGTVINVTDYWVVDDQLHFKMIEAIGQKPIEQSIPFEELDLQKTIDTNSARGFRVVLRNAPYEEYLRNHPEPPQALTPQLK